MGRVRTPLARERKFSGVRERLAIRRKELKARTIGKRPEAPKFSIVSAVYNVEKYLDDYFHSIVLQPEFLSQIQVIVVNDGSTDGSLNILNAWARRFPHNIHVVSKENGGQASARNLGMTYATGEWITFIDPDDFVAPNYIAEVNRFISTNSDVSSPIQIASCNFIVFKEDYCTFEDSHPLKYRFNSEAVVSISDPGQYLQLSVNSAFFKRDAVAANAIDFNPNVRPNFEDADFVCRFMMATQSGSIAFLPQARYYYRKRADGSSSLDGANICAARYDDVFRAAHIPLLEQATRSYGRPPRWLQRTILYDVMWQIKALMNNSHKLHFLTPSQIEQFGRHLETVFSYIDTGTIEDFELAGNLEMHRIGILGRFKGERPSKPRVVVGQLDDRSNTLIATWYSGSPKTKSQLQLDGVDLPILDRKCQLHTYLGSPFVFENRVLLPLRNGALTASIDGKEASVKVPGKGAASVQHIRVPSPKRVAAGHDFSGCWLLMDRDTQADDNAEHLYRHLMRHRPDVKAYFVLRRDSHDWDRLSAEGFRLIKFGSPDHDRALAAAKYLISSHADRYVTHRHAKNEVPGYRYVFLQHGVIQNDLSHWLNGKPISLMVTTTYGEHQSIVSSPSKYKLLPSEVALTGLPRHDALLTRNRAPHRRLLIAPTWREGIVMPGTSNGNARALNPNFMQTDYACAWQSLLQSPRLKAALEEYDFEAVFFPHVNVQPYLSQFDIPERIQVLTHEECGSFQELLISSSMMLTDYSSVAFDAAFLLRQVIYYQFDCDLVFSGGHMTRRGYFDYTRDGFGPVCQDEAGVLDAIEHSLRNDGEPDEEYRLRCLTSFVWRDGRNCERVVDAIERIGRWPDMESPLARVIAQEAKIVHFTPDRHYATHHMNRRMSTELLSALSSRECGC